MLDIYVPNIGALKYIKQILTDLKGKIDNTIIEVNTPLSTIDKLIPKENQWGKHWTWTIL